MVQEKLKAKKRKTLGKKVKKMRREGILPGIIYGSKFESTPISFPLSEFQATYKIVGETNVLEIVLEKESHSVLVKQVQLHPLSDLPLHVDFYRVDLTQKVTAKVPLKFVGESEAVKTGLGILLELINEIEVEALPNDIPSSFSVDVSVLENLNDTLTIGNLDIPSGVEIKIDSQELICKIDEPKMKEVVEEVVEEEVVEGEEGEEDDVAEGEEEEEEKEVKEEKPSK